MKPAQIFHQYIWIINTLRAYRKLTLEELNQKWIDDGVADGNPLGSGDGSLTHSDNCRNCQINSGFY